MVRSKVDHKHQHEQMDLMVDNCVICWGDRSKVGIEIGCRWSVSGWWLGRKTIALTDFNRWPQIWGMDFLCHMIRHIRLLGWSLPLSQPNWSGRGNSFDSQTSSQMDGWLTVLRQAPDLQRLWSVSPMSLLHSSIYIFRIVFVPHGHKSIPKYAFIVQTT